MYEPLIAMGIEFLSLSVYIVGTLGLSALGLIAEYNSIQQFLSGQQLLAGWLAFMGIVALVFAWNLGREKLFPRFAEQISS